MTTTLTSDERERRPTEQTEMSNKKSDWQTIICPTCNHDVTTNAPDVLLSRINSALAVERRAAFRDAARLATTMAAGETFETGRQKALNIAAALEAAAERKEEGARDTEKAQ